jgi:hypothetical protein
MREVAPTMPLIDWLLEYESRSGVIDYVLIASDHADPVINFDNPLVAAFGMDVVQQRNKDKGYSLIIRSEPERALPSPIDSREFMKDYWYAFQETPYGLRSGRHDVAEIFEAINQETIGTIEGAHIVAWSTDWSNYFDAGREWWGTFMWTVKPANHDWIVWIGASATD